MMNLRGLLKSNKNIGSCEALAYYNVPGTNEKAGIYSFKILTKTVSTDLSKISNTIVCGNTAGYKDRCYIKPNLLQGNTSFIVFDCKGEFLQDTGHLMKALGYKIKVLNLCYDNETIGLNRSDKYNPFIYLKTDKDIFDLADALHKATKGFYRENRDPFYDNNVKLLLYSLLLYVHTEFSYEKQNFSTVLTLLENDMSNGGSLDLLFDKLPDYHFAKTIYKDYKKGGIPQQEIETELLARLAVFKIDFIKELTSTDTLELDKFGEEKSILYILGSDIDFSLNCITSILYKQAFQELFYSADYKYMGKLPVPVHFIMDDFGAVKLFNSFDKILGLSNSHNIFVSIIITNLAELKKALPTSYETILGICDEFLYTGGGCRDTYQYISELLENSLRKSISYDETRRLDNSKAILFRQGKKSIIDLKYDYSRHPNFKFTASAGFSESRIYKPYIHRG